MRILSVQGSRIVRGGKAAIVLFSAKFYYQQLNGGASAELFPGKAFGILGRELRPDCLCGLLLEGLFLPLITCELKGKLLLIGAAYVKKVAKSADHLLIHYE